MPQAARLAAEPRTGVVSVRHPDDRLARSNAFDVNVAGTLLSENVLGLFFRRVVPRAASQRDAAGANVTFELFGPRRVNAAAQIVGDATARARSTKGCGDGRGCCAARRGQCCTAGDTMR